MGLFSKKKKKAPEPKPAPKSNANPPEQSEKVKKLAKKCSLLYIFRLNSNSHLNAD